jgi:hypothetical protein
MAKRGILTIQQDAQGKEILTASRDNGEGTNEAVTDVNIDGLNVQEFYQDQDFITFSKNMNGITISNDGEYPLTAYINGMKINVKAGEVFTERFKPFKEVIIETLSSFRVYGLGFGGTSTVNAGFTLYNIPPALGLTESGTTGKIYRGSVIQMRQARKLTSFGLIGNLTGWQVWEVDSNNKFVGTAPLDSGTFTGTTSTTDFNMVTLATPLQLVSGKRYIIIGIYVVAPTLTKARFKWKTDADYKQADNALLVAGNSYQDDVVPAAGVVIGTTGYVYQAKYIFGGV